MSDPPDKSGGSAAPMTKDDAVRTATPAPAEASTDKPSAASSPKVGAARTATPAPAETSTDKPMMAPSPPEPTSRFEKLEAELEAAQHEAAELREKVQKLELQLRTPHPTAISRLAEGIEDRFSQMIKLQEEAIESFVKTESYRSQVAKDRATLDAERQAWEAQRQTLLDDIHGNGNSAITAVKDLNATACSATEAEANRPLSQHSKNDDVYNVCDQAEVAKAMADQKTEPPCKEASVEAALSEREHRIEQQEKALHSLHEMPGKSNVLDDTGKAPWSEERKYALSDRKIKALTEEHWLSGYVECSLAWEYRRAAQGNLDIDMSLVEYLKDMSHPKNPYQVGMRIGNTFGWRTLCQLVVKSDLDPRKWTWREFSSVHEEILEGSVWHGVERGFAVAEKRFLARRAEETEKASFQSVDNKGKGKQKPEGKNAAPMAKKLLEPQAGPAKEGQPVENRRKFSSKTSQSRGQGSHASADLMEPSLHEDDVESDDD
ncbi:hypothetical protein N0V94_006701 [Neodidymelliopsis sp. IMI 364377]|nr:hypothetical protein N0V94_006701 [Neodidymelliopsis sp. IMI 364377]